jgi:hypothetical protein
MPLLFKGGKLVFRGGVPVFWDGVSPCSCCTPANPCAEIDSTKTTPAEWRVTFSGVGTSAGPPHNGSACSTCADWNSYAVDLPQEYSAYIPHYCVWGLEEAYTGFPCYKGSPGNDYDEMHFQLLPLVAGSTVTAGFGVGNSSNSVGFKKTLPYPIDPTVPIVFGPADYYLDGLFICDFSGATVTVTPL